MHPISDTSALVLLWARGFYRSHTARAYLEQLDHARGQELHRACNAIYGEYAQVIWNRKHGTMRMAADLATAAPQFVMAGAGLDPMGAELAASHPQCRVFEVDRDQMELKAELLANSPSAFITADLQDPEAVIHGLRAAGWDPARPTALVLEGITYYMPPQSLAELAQALQPHHAIAEWLKPPEQLSSAAASIAERIFGLISQRSGLPPATRYTAEGLASLLQMELADRWPMPRLEQERTGANRHFPAERDAWIEMALLSRPPAAI